MDKKFSLLKKYFESLPPLPRGEHRVVAGIFHKNKLISLGFNQKKTHPRQVLSQKNFNEKRQFLHAEIHALIQAQKYQLKNLSMYVYRQTRNGVPALARPCAGCFAALASAGVDVVWSGQDTCKQVTESTSVAAEKCYSVPSPRSR
jgi:tRNA(Arg) A34 adenosine deaminase TadA